MNDILQLLEEANTLKSSAAEVQNEAVPLEKREVILSELYERYHAWYRRSLIQFERFNEADKKEKFEKEYEGGLIITQILGFLTEGLKISVLYNPENPQFPKWQHPANLRFQKPIEKQCNILSTLQIHFESKTNKEKSTNTLTVLVSKSDLKAIPSPKMT